MIFGFQTSSMEFQVFYNYVCMCSINNITSSFCVNYSSLRTRCYEMSRERFPTLLRHPHLRPSLVSPIYRQFKNNSLNGYFKRCQNFSFNNLGIDSKVRGELTNLLRKTTKQTIPTKTGTANRPVSGYQFMYS